MCTRAISFPLKVDLDTYWGWSVFKGFLEAEFTGSDAWSHYRKSLLLVWAKEHWKRPLSEMKTIGWSFTLFENACCFICSLFGTVVGLKISLCSCYRWALAVSQGSKMSSVSLELESSCYELEIVVMGWQFVRKKPGTWVHRLPLAVDRWMNPFPPPSADMVSF